MNVKKYVLAKEENDIYSFNIESKSPVIKVKDDKLIFNEKEYDLEGKTLTDWLKENPEELKHNRADSSKPGSSEVFTYNENLNLFEVKLDENEDYFITTAQKNSTEEINKDFLVFNGILNDLKTIFNFIEPSDSHLDVFGLNIRDLIIKAASEVENQWKQLIRINGYDKEYLTTRDYSKLLEFIDFDLPIKINGYDCDVIFRPFRHWSKEKPSKSIIWYDAYNQLKHDRTSYKTLATFENVINTVGAVYVLMIIRYDNMLVSRKVTESIFSPERNIKFSKHKIMSYKYAKLSTKHLKYFEN